MTANRGFLRQRKGSSVAASSLPVPTEQRLETARRNGRGLLRKLPDQWACSCCDRNLREIVRWSPRQRNFFAAVSHHDHQFDRRFQRTVICQDCNDVDGNLKTAFPDLVRRRWSFAIAEIREIITPVPHQKHIVDFAPAHELALRVLAGKGENTVRQLRLEL
jgi:hypothetical protein